jgi:hypothetical protein
MFAWSGLLLRLTSIGPYPVRADAGRLELAARGRDPVRHRPHVGKEAEPLRGDA